MRAFSGNSGIRIIFSTDNPGNTTIGIYDLSGRLLQQLPVKSQPGKNTVFWDGNDHTGKVCAIRCFIIVLQKDKVKIARKVVLFR